MRSFAGLDSFRVGVVAVVCLGLLGAGILALSMMRVGTKTYTVELAQTAGLRPTEEVSVHGVTAGEVRSIKLGKDRVLVRFTLDKNIQLGAQTSAKVKVATLLGTHMLAIYPEGNGTLPNDTIPLERTSVPFNLQDVVEEGARTLEQVDAKQLAKMLTEMAKFADATADQLGPALTGITQLSEAVAARMEQTGQLMSGAKKVTDELSASSKDMAALMRQANLVLEELTSRREAVHTLLVETSRLADNLQAVMQATDADLGPAFRKLNQVIKILRAEDAAIKNLVKTGSPAVRYVANAAGNGPWGELWTKQPALPANDSCHGALRPLLEMMCVK